jgi:hypothetical protein
MRQCDSLISCIAADIQIHNDALFVMFAFLANKYLQNRMLIAAITNHLDIDPMNMEVVAWK